MAKTKISIDDLRNETSFLSVAPQRVSELPAVPLFTPPSVPKRETALVADTKKSFYVDDDTYNIIKGYVIHRRKTDSPLFSMREAMTVFAEWIQEKHPTVESFTGKLR